jgi:hypothetical protein
MRIGSERPRKRYCGAEGGEGGWLGWNGDLIEYDRDLE